MMNTTLPMAGARGLDRVATGTKPQVGHAPAFLLHYQEVRQQALA
jgi:hypothetical protein